MYRLPMLLGLTAEALAGILLWLGADASAGAWAIAGVIFLHVLSSYFFAQAFWQLLPRRYKLPPPQKPGFSVFDFIDFTGTRCAGHIMERDQCAQASSQPFFTGHSGDHPA